MNTIRIIVPSLVLVCPATAHPEHASGHAAEAARPVAEQQLAPDHGHAHGEEPEWAAVFGGATLPVVWHSLAAANERIAAALKNQQLDGVADWAETIHLAAHALMDQVEVPENDRKQRLDAALGQAARLADDVLDGAQHNDAPATSAAHRRLASAVALIKSRLPAEISEANIAQDDLRFATAGQHGHEH